MNYLQSVFKLAEASGLAAGARYLPAIPMQGLEPQSSSNRTLLVPVHQSFDRVHCKSDGQADFERPGPIEAQAPKSD